MAINDVVLVASKGPASTTVGGGELNGVEAGATIVFGNGQGGNRRSIGDAGQVLGLGGVVTTGQQCLCAKNDG